MSITILPRSTWTTAAKGFPRFAGRAFVKAQVTACVLHYPAIGASVGVLTVAQECAWFRGFRNYHVGTRGWADIGYNLGVTQAGRVYELAGDTHAAAHGATTSYPRANHETLGILLLLGDNEAPTAAMVNAVNALLRHERYSRGFTALRAVLGHQQVRGASTRCPGPFVMALVHAGTFHYGTPAAAPAPAKPAAPPKVADGTVLTVTAARLNTRSGPGLQHGVVGGADKGAEVRATGRTSGPWVQAATKWQRDRKLTTWWHSDHLKVKSQPKLEAAKPTPAPKPSTSTSNPPRGGVHVVRSGETLGGIATRYGTSVKALQTLNGIANPDRIERGQRVYVAWVVASGQTLGGIATRTGTTTAALVKKNGLANPDRIEPGQLIVIP